MAFPRRCRAKNTHPHGKWQIIYAHTGNMMLRHISVRERKAEKPRLFVRHTRIHAGSGHSVKAKPCRAATRALTFMPWLPASYSRGRRTRKPPAGARSKEVHNAEAQRQQYKNRFLTSHGSSPYRHAAGTIHTNPPQRMLRRVLPIHAPRPPARHSNVCSIMCIMLTLLGAGYRPHGFRMAIRLPPHTVFP